MQMSCVNDLDYSLRGLIAENTNGDDFWWKPFHNVGCGQRRDLTWRRSKHKAQRICTERYCQQRIGLGSDSTDFYEHVGNGSGEYRPDRGLNGW
jgi:hypothetical protein